MLTNQVIVREFNKENRARIVGQAVEVVVEFEGEKIGRWNGQLVAWLCGSSWIPVKDLADKAIENSQAISDNSGQEA